RATMADALEFRECLVCTTPITATHFGMDTCRACSSFFKRVKTSGKSYNCRRGDGKCSVITAKKAVCRSCRFEKCLAIGLKYDGPLRINKKAQEDSPDPAHPLNLTSATAETVVDRIGRQFNTSMETRRVQERVFLSKCDETARIPHPTEELYVTSYDTLLRTYDFVITATWELFKTCFPSLQALTLSEQEQLFGQFLPKFSMMEAHYRTRKIWGSAGDYLIASALVCADLRNPDSWVGRNDGGSNRKSLIESIAQYTNEQCEIIVPMMNRVQMTAKEFHASLALLLCDCDAAQDASPLLDEIQKEVIDELQHYYKMALGLADFSTRLGNLMTLVHTVRECAALYQEFFRAQVALFDMYTAQEKFMKLFL
ncbi:hypothetical protein PMAYCL1PPCAC_16689, partial [Pristionchus mayeri]